MMSGVVGGTQTRLDARLPHHAVVVAARGWKKRVLMS